MKHIYKKLNGETGEGYPALIDGKLIGFYEIHRIEAPRGINPKAKRVADEVLIIGVPRSKWKTTYERIWPIDEKDND